MSRQRIRHLPVVEAGKPVGMVFTGGLTAMQASESQACIEDLYHYLHGRT